MFFVNAGFVAYTMRFYSIISDCFVVLSYQSFQAQYSTKARQLSASHGSVLLHLDNGKTCDLKKDTTARSMLQMMDTAPKKGFDLTVTDPADVTGFLRYMLEAGRTERVAG